MFQTVVIQPELYTAINNISQFSVKDFLVFYFFHYFYYLQRCLTKILQLVFPSKVEHKFSHYKKCWPRFLDFSLGVYKIETRNKIETCFKNS